MKIQSKICMQYVILILWVYLLKGAASDPGINLLSRGCNPYNVSSFKSFTNSLQSIFRELRTQLDNGTKLYAIAQRPSGPDPVYGMFQCRGYMSTADCVACFNEATVQIKECNAAVGARVLNDGCFLRYESNDRFYVEGTTEANNALCNRTNLEEAPNTPIRATIQALLSELVIATPKINNLYAVSKKEVIGATNVTVYAIAQCVQSVFPMSCDICLQVAKRNLRRCVDASARAVDSGCFMRYSDKQFFADNQAINLSPFLRTKGSNLKKTLIIIGGAGGGVASLLIVALLFWYKQSMKRKQNPRGDILDATELRGPVNYRYKDLKSATENFKEGNKLGEGGFGDVYKGTLKNGKIVAVKRLALGQSSRARADFKSEVTLISNVHHCNLLRLLGCSGKGPELLLVYEYMANKSLDRFLYGKERRLLTWKQRFDVILGTAQGLAYLHEQFHVCIIHRDIKSSNILLDNAFQPKIADFGLARLLPNSQSHINTRFAGTLGYTAPEYAIHGQLSEKVDTYSYGIVVLEVISGKKCSEMIVDPGAEYLLKRVWNLYEDGAQHLKLVDERLDPNQFEVEDMERVIKIALMCTQSSPTLRPTMSEVVALLKSKSSLEGKPLSRPPFIELEAKVRVKDKSSTSFPSSTTSNATISITELSGR